MKAPYLFYLYHEGTGAIQLKYEPDFSDDLSIVFGRDSKYHGVFRQVGLNIKFVKDGKKYLQEIYETFGVEADVVITVQKLNRLINSYELYFEGKIDFAIYHIEELYVKVGIEETGITQKFKARDDVPVNLQSLKTKGGLTVPAFTKEVEEVTLHSKKIAKRFTGFSDKTIAEEFYDPNKERIEPGLSIFQTKGYTRHFMFSFYEEVNEIEGMTPTGFSFLQDVPAPILVVEEPGVHNFNLSLNYAMRVTGSANPSWGHVEGCQSYGNGGGAFNWIKIDVFFVLTNSTDPSRNETITVRHYEEDGCGLRDYLVEDVVSQYISRDLIIGDEISIYGKIETESRWFRPGPGVNYDFYTDFYITQNVFNTLDVYALTSSPVPTSAANSIMIFEALARNAQAITDHHDAFRSTLYGRTDSEPFSYVADGEASLRVITNGFQIRQFPLTEKPLYASFKDLYDTLDAIDNIGVGIEDNKIVVEKKEYFYDSSIILTLSNVADIKKSVAKEYYHNEYEFGYQKWENEEVNGLDEYNSTRRYSNIITAIKNKLSKLSPYIASGYAIEFTRRNVYNQTSTKDWKYDNDNFIISVVRNEIGYQSKKIEGYELDKFAKILDPASAYNLDITPMRRAFIRWGNVIKASVLKYLANPITFAFGTGNYDAESKRTDEAAVVKEGNNGVATTLQNPIWIPEYYEFEAPVRTVQLAAIRANPYGQIEFSESETNFKYGYIINVKVNSEENKGTFKLLRAYR